MEKHELFEVLDAANPRWQTQHATLALAAAAYGASELYEEYLRSDSGRLYLRYIRSAHDHRKDNEARARQLAAERTMAAAAMRDRSAVNLEDTVREEMFSDVE